MLRRGLLIAAAALLGLTKSVSADVLPQFSFVEPYDKIDTNGKRVISEHVNIGGSVEVKKNFVRLTPDRQSKRGHIWSKSTIDRDEFAAIVTFRIHGQGKKWYGDGIGVWMTHDAGYVNGENHGYTDQYYGMGILLDTFRNVEHKGGHKDITLQFNNGKKTLDDLNSETKIGCDSDFRYHSGSASFDPVYSTSRIRIKIKGNHLELQVDARSDGRWKLCYEGDLPFSPEWMRRAKFGITASTGSLADNHDIIKVTAYDDLLDHGLSIADAEVWTHNYSKDFDKEMDLPTCDQDCKIMILQKFVENFGVASEHWFEDLREQTQNTIDKLRAKEKMNHQKIEALVKRMENMMDDKIGRKMADVRDQVHAKIATQVEGDLVVAQASWRLPFFVLMLLLGGAVAFAYQKYQKLIKSHLI